MSLLVQSCTRTLTSNRIYQKRVSIVPQFFEGIIDQFVELRSKSSHNSHVIVQLIFMKVFESLRPVVLLSFE